MLVTFQDKICNRFVQQQHCMKSNTHTLLQWRFVARCSRALGRAVCLCFGTSAWAESSDSYTTTRSTVTGHPSAAPPTQTTDISQQNPSSEHNSSEKHSDTLTGNVSSWARASKHLTRSSVAPSAATLLILFSTDVNFSPVTDGWVRQHPCN